MPSAIEWALIALGALSLMKGKKSSIDQETGDTINNPDPYDPSTPGGGGGTGGNVAGAVVNSSEITSDELHAIWIKCSYATVFDKENFVGDYQIRYQNNYLDEIYIIGNRAMSEKEKVDRGDKADKTTLSAMASNLMTAGNCYNAIRRDLRIYHPSSQCSLARFTERVGPPFLALKNYINGLREKYVE